MTLAKGAQQPFLGSAAGSPSAISSVEIQKMVFNWQCNSSRCHYVGACCCRHKCFGWDGSHVLHHAILSRGRASMPIIQNGRMQMKVEMMEPFLSRYMDIGAAGLFRDGYVEGFWNPCHLPLGPLFADNLLLAQKHPDIGMKKLRQVVAAWLMAGPYHSLSFQGLVVFPLGVVPKKEASKF